MAMTLSNPAHEDQGALENRVRDDGGDNDMDNDKDDWLRTLLDVEDGEMEKMAAEMPDDFAGMSSDSEGSTSTMEAENAFTFDVLDFGEIHFSPTHDSLGPMDLPPDSAALFAPSLPIPSAHEQGTQAAPPTFCAPVNTSPAAANPSPQFAPPSFRTSASGAKPCKRKPTAASAESRRPKRRASSAASTRSSGSSTSGYSSSGTSEDSSFSAGAPPSAETMRQMKLKRKRERNRILAAESRQRRKDHMESLEIENEALRRRVQELENEVATLRGQRPAVDAESQRAHAHAVTMRGTKMGAAAMAVATSMVVFTDSSQAGASSSANYNEMISFWALGLDLLSGSGVALDRVFAHMLVLFTCIAVSLAVVGLYYFRVLRAKRPEAAPTFDCAASDADAGEMVGSKLPLFTRRQANPSHHKSLETGVCSTPAAWTFGTLRAR